MTRVLEFDSRAAVAGSVKSLVVLVHGYGADGADLLGLADPLGTHLPHTAFVAPNAPERCSGNPFGYQWFPIPGLMQAADDLNAFLDAQLAHYALPPEALALIGFSQGSMISLHIAPRRAAPLAGVVAFSGRLLMPERLQAEACVFPPILLAHGDQDPVVPFEDMAKAGQALSDSGFETFGHVMRGTGHGIAPDGLSAALQFLHARLPDAENMPDA